MKLTFSRVKFLRFILSVVLAVPLSPAYAESNYVQYQVHGDESLSRILYDKYKLSPVYGKKGYIHQVVVLNRGKILKQGNLIRSGDILLIPVANVAGRDIANESVVAAPLSQVPEEAPQLPAPASAVQKEFVPNSELDFSVGASYLALFGRQTSNQTSSILLSTLTPTLDISWRQNWSEETSSRFFVGLKSIHLAAEQNGTPLSPSDFLNSAFGIGLRHQFNGRWAIDLDAELAQTLFCVGQAGGALAIEQAPLIRLHPRLQMNLLKRRPLELSALLGGSYFGASSYDNYTIQAGYGYDGSLQMAQEFRKNILKCRVSYAERRQNTTYLELAQKDVGLACDFSWQLGENGAK